MLVEILLTADYADFSQPGRVLAQRLEAGDRVEFPAEYATGLIKSGLAKAVEVAPVEPSARAEETPVEPAPVEPAPRKKGRR